MKNKLEIKQIKINDLIPYVNNARTHSKEQISQIAASIKEFGFNDPIACDGENGIIEGHGRLLAAKKLGLKNVPVIELSHLSEMQKKAYILAHNKLAENAEWDIELLDKELNDLIDFNFSFLGFDSKKDKKNHDIDQEYNDKNCEMPIVPDFFERHQCFIIVTHNEIDENFVRESLGLTENHKSNSGDKKIRKCNIVEVDQLRELWENK